ncbi:MAG: phospholipid carrier-dependent glycosyltransferase [Candidatus Syntropharchaeia archaeon]
MKLERDETVIICVLTIIFFCIGIWNLGKISIPETSWSPSKSGESFYIDLGNQKQIRSIYFLETDHLRKDYTIYTGNPENWNKVSRYKHEGYFMYWNKVSLNANSRYIRFVSNVPAGRLSEIVIYGPEKGKKLEISSIYGESENLNNLIDEQEKVEDPPSHMSGTYFDEIYFARTAYEYIHHLEPFEWTHPPLGKIIIALGMLAFGVNPFGWRIMEFLIGCLYIPVFYFFGKKLFKGKFGGFLCAFLITFESMHFVLSRIGMIDIFLTFFLTLMFYFFFLYYDGFKKGWKSAGFPIFLSGICFGLAFSTKWTGFYGAVAILVLFLFLKCEEYLKIEKKKGFFREYIRYPLLIAFISFFLVSFVIYISSYIPFMLVPGPGHGIKEIFSYQFNMYAYHSGLTATHPYSSPWWSWPLLLKPVFLYLGSDFPGELVSRIVLLGNPTIWWMSIPCLIYVGWNAIKRKDRSAIFIVIPFLMQWIPYSSITRILFLYHFFPNVPFMIFGISYSLIDLWKKKYGNYIVFAYLSIVLICFTYFYPITSGIPISPELAEEMKWLGSWVW